MKRRAELSDRVNAAILDRKKLRCSSEGLEQFALRAGHPGLQAERYRCYFAVRAAMAKSVSHALRQIAGRGVLEESTSAIARLLS